MGVDVKWNENSISFHCAHIIGKIGMDKCCVLGEDTGGKPFEKVFDAADVRRSCLKNADAVIWRDNEATHVGHLKAMHDEPKTWKDHCKIEWDQYATQHDDLVELRRLEGLRTTLPASVPLDKLEYVQIPRPLRPGKGNVTLQKGVVFGTGTDFLTDFKRGCRIRFKDDAATEATVDSIINASELKIAEKKKEDL